MKMMTTVHGEYNCELKFALNEISNKKKRSRKKNEKMAESFAYYWFNF